MVKGFTVKQGWKWWQMNIVGEPKKVPDCENLEMILSVIMMILRM